MRGRWIAIVILLAACKQGPGERCQLTRDCESGLTCVLPKSWTCPDQNPMCPACLPGGTCQAPDDDSRRCTGDSDCLPGHLCVPSSSCGEEGASTCAGRPPDMSAPDDLGESDASADAGVIDL
jgi:hypothetical protein